MVRIEGKNLDLIVTDALEEKPKLRVPDIVLEPVSGLAKGSPAKAQRASVVPPDRVHWLKNGVVEFLVDNKMGLAPGAYDVVVRSPGRPDARFPEGLVVVGRPFINGVEPAEVCHDNKRAPFTIKGADFLVVDGVPPAVTVGTEAAAQVEGTGCKPLAGAVDGQVCTGLDVRVDATGQPLGFADFSVMNPPPVACESRTQARIDIKPPPTIETVDPPAICEGGGTITITGADFTQDVEVDVGVPADDIRFVDDRTLIVTLADVPVGNNDVVVTLNECQAVLEEGLRVASNPLVFFVDPPTLYGGLDTDVTAFVSDVVGEITDVWLTDSNGTRVEVTWTWELSEPGLISASVPKGLPDGDYTLHVLEDADCAGELSGALSINSTPTVAVEAVDPPFSWTFNFTAVDILAEDPIPGGMVGFGDTPTVYLIGPDPQTEAIKVLGLVWKTDKLLSGLVPELPVGMYDLLVVNPDGSVGLLEDALESTFDPPPTIDTVGPASLSNQNDETVEIVGRDFRNPTVSMECRDTTGNETTIPVTVDGYTYSTIDATVPSTGMTSGTICVFVVTNADLSEARWAAASVTNPSQNPFDWQVGSSLVVPRRAPAGGSGRTTSVDRYVFAIGGDDGDPANAMATIESAPVGVYGDVGTWQLLPRGLPEPRTLAVSAVIGPFIYVVGGHNGTGPVDTVLRARILDPIDVPYFENLSVNPGNGNGLGRGQWIYRVAALYDATDAYNPGGESLPSEPIVITLPAVPGKLQPTLTWKSIYAAVGYRIYRSPVADAGLGNEEWIGDVMGATEFIDDGSATDPARTPLPLGSLGEWASLPTMSTARQSPCIAVAPDPFPDPEKMYLYVGGGLDANGDTVDTIEWLDIEIVTPDQHDAGGWKLSANTFDEGRYECAGYAIDGYRHSVVPLGESWVYFAGGKVQNGQESKTIEVGLVQDKGELVMWQKLPSNESLSPSRAGMAYAAASDFLYMFGGQGGPSESSSTSALDGTDMPHLINWNATGTSLSVARYLPGSAQESAVIFVIGGTDSNGPLTTVDFTNF